MNNIYLSYPGIVTCSGLNIEEIWNSVTTGIQSGIKKITAINGETFFVGKINEDRIEATTARFNMRIQRIQEMALNQIADNVEKLKKKVSKERIAICVGSCDNGSEFSIAGHKFFFETGKFPKEYSIEMQGADYVSTFVKEKFLLSGPCLSFSTACSSSAEAIIKGAEFINSGIADAVIVGGVDIVSDIVLLGFNSLNVVSSKVANPFSKNRNGITLGEGAAFFIMTKEDIFDTGIKLLGYGESADAYHMTSPEPSADGARRAIENALKCANLKPTDIDYINLHGTGTRTNDMMESKAVDLVFGEYKIPASTIKSLIGHTLGASSAIELAICFESIIKNRNAKKIVFPLQNWDGQIDKDIPSLNFIDKKNKLSCNRMKICMSNSFAFGGSNCCLIVGEE